MAVGFSFQKAKREKIWVKLLLNGPSGSGKTYTALRLATGMLSKVGGAGIAAIDTENGRIRYYANEFEFFDLQLGEPYTSESYIEAINAAVDNGFKVLIIDSLSHEWKWLNEIHDKMPGNSFTNWGKLKPRHAALMEKILQSPIHIIATARGKDDYVMEDKNGKQIPKKVGVGSQQEKDIEYNYTVTFNIDQETHVASVAKDNTHLFEGRYDKLTEKDGSNLIDWATSGEGEMPTEPVSKPTFVAPSDSNDLDSKVIECKDLFASRMDEGISKDFLYDIVKKHNAGNKNFMQIKDIDVLNTIIKEIKEV